MDALGIGKLLRNHNVPFPLQEIQDQIPFPSPFPLKNPDPILTPAPRKEKGLLLRRL
jgi:hypothetical protein